MDGLAVGHHLEHPVAVQIGELHGEDLPRGPSAVTPLGLEHPVHDPVEEDALSVGDDEAGDPVLGRDGNVHGHDGKAEAGNLREGDPGLPARVGRGLQLASEDPGQERALLGLGRLAGLASARKLPLGSGLDRGRHEEGRAEQRRRGRRRVETDLHVGLVLDPFEIDHQELLDLEALHGSVEAFPFDNLFTLDPLLAEPDIDLVSHGHLEAAAPVEPLDELMDRRLRQALFQTGEKRKEGEPDLPCRDPRLVPWTDVRSLGDRAGRVRLEDLAHQHPPQDLLGPPKDLPRPGMPQLASLAVERELDPGLEAVPLPHGKRQRRALDLDHLTVHFGEERGDLLDQDRERRRSGLSPGGGRQPEDEKTRPCDPTGGTHRILNPSLPGASYWGKWAASRFRQASAALKTFGSAVCSITRKTLSGTVGLRSTPTTAPIPSPRSR